MLHGTFTGRVVVTGLSVVCLIGQRPVSVHGRPQESQGVAERTACERLTKLTLPQATITLAQVVEPGAFSPPAAGGGPAGGRAAGAGRGASAYS